MKKIIKNNNMIKFDLDDINIVPNEVSNIKSRSEIITKDLKNIKLPIFNAPMDTVINDNNYHHYTNINIVIPRKKTEDIKHSSEYYDKVFVSYSLYQFKRFFIDVNSVSYNKILEKKHYVLIDIANGHMKDLIDAVKKAKNMYGDTLCLIVGNIANPITYKLLSEAGADYVRVGIGGGSGCLTTQQISVGFPLGSLLEECNALKKEMKNPAYIIADGGMKKYSDAIKVLALGADYFMIGGIINKSFESAGSYYFKGIKIPKKIAKFLFDRKFKIYKKFRGMSTKEVQQSWGNKKLTTSEGIIKYNKVEYYFDTWLENFEDYLKSAMSYTDSKTLKDFIGNVEYNVITQRSIKRYEK